MGKLFDKQYQFSQDMAMFVFHLEGIEGLKFSIREVYRTSYQQREYVRRGLSQTYKSKHRDGLAFDCVFEYNGVYLEDYSHWIFDLAADTWESINPKNVAGHRWNFKDSGHFQQGQ